MINLDWDHLSFSYTKTNTMLITTYEDGKWSDVESRSNDDVIMSSFAGALHYGVSCFEGLKVFRGIDGKLRIFRPEENARRMQDSARALFMPEP
ncbi:MAG: branched chain amino acid aminotransferase, partial [Bacteroidales bacterium]|nr:branched chain amino acid aminotransferase [Bacteroidales bacterium]